MGIELFLLAALGGLVAFDTFRKKSPTGPSPSDFPTVPISNRPTAKLAEEWESKLRSSARDYYWDPKLAETDPYRAIAESRHPNVTRGNKTAYSGYPTIPSRER
jgi:hypothetical protein